MSSFNETVFITGFPGFIAGRLVSRLSKPKTQFYLLVQRNFVEKAMKEIERIAAETKTPLENFAIIEGDVTAERLGMSTADWGVVTQETTAVYHLAAAYDLAVPLSVGHAVNVIGTQNVNELVKSGRSLTRYNYVSTCYVAGNRKGRVREDELAHESGFRNFYEQTKYEAELEVAKLIPRYPVTIFRPSVVVGDSQTGETVKYDGIYYVMKYLRRFPALFRLVNVGNDIATVNLVPVDFVVDGIIALADDPRAIGKTIALADPNPLTTAAACDLIAEAISGKKSVAKLPPSLMQKILLMPFTPIVSGLPKEGVPYFFSPQEFDTTVATELLSNHGIKCPAFPDYVKTLVKFVEKNPKL